MSDKENINIKSLKITLPLKPEQIPRDIIPPEGTPGSAKAKAVWNLELEGDPPLVIETSFPIKHYRKVLKNIDEKEGEDVIVLLQGRLLGNNTIDGAGLSVQVRKPKEEDIEN